MPRVLWLLLALCFLPAALPAQENLLPNPGFESVTNGQPSGGWWLYQGLGKVDLKMSHDVSHSGHAAAQLHADEPSKAVLVSPHFPVVPGDEIRFSAWARGEQLPANAAGAFVGLAFRRKDGSVFGRVYVPSSPIGQTWSLISGEAVAPAEAFSAEVHLGYTNAPGRIWYDDVSAIITSPLSMGLSAGAKPWPGEQEIALRITNRQTNGFRGMLIATAGRQQRTLPVTLEPKSERDFIVPLRLDTIGLQPCRFTLKSAQGEVVRTLAERFRISPPLVLYPACPCYHLAGLGDGATRLDARINLNPAQRNGLTMTVALAAADGQVLRTAQTDASQRETAGLSIEVPVTKPAGFTLTARLVDRTGKELASEQMPVRVIAAGESRVSIGSDGFLRVAGSPQFPIGLYSASHYEELGRAGFTATHSYSIVTGEATEPINPNDAELERLLDLSWTNGMRMMVELPRKAVEQGRWDQVRRRIETFKHHPGLLCWGSEERVARGTAPLANLEALYQLVHQLDPDHPLVLGDTRDVIQKFRTDRRDFFPDSAMDAGIWWWYPIPLKEPDADGLKGNAGLMEPPSWLTTTLSKKPLWIAIQAYQKPSRTASFPTPAQYRCQAYLSIINGVKGLFFYTGSGQRDYQGTPAGLLNKPQEAHWDYVQHLVRELRQFSPVIMAPRSAAQIRLDPADAPVEFTTRELNGTLYLIAANKSSQAQSVRFSGSTFNQGQIEVLYEDHSVGLNAGTLADQFSRFGVHVYAIHPVKP